MVAVLIFVAFVCGKGASNVQPGETPTPFLYAAGTRVQLAVPALATGSHEYLRVDKLQHGSLVSVGTTPWMLGSTLELHPSDDMPACFYIKSMATMRFLTVHGTGLAARATAATKKEAPMFMFMGIGTSTGLHGKDGEDNLVHVRISQCRAPDDTTDVDALPMQYLAFPSQAAASAMPVAVGARDPIPASLAASVHDGQAVPALEGEGEGAKAGPGPGPGAHTPQLSVYVTEDASKSVFALALVERVRGVNTGGWFIPEVWMSRSVYNDSSLGYDLGWGGSLCGLVKYSRAIAEQKMAHQFDTWITEQDFKRMAALGLNSVRVPIGYWNIIHDPYHMFAPANLSRSLEKIDQAFDWADKYGMTVLLDLHGGPGSQNGIDHSGCAAPSTWLTPENQELSVAAVAAMVDRYVDRPNLYGFELLNEPSKELTVSSHAVLLSFYTTCYKLVRARSASAVVVFNELYVPFLGAWDGQLSEPDFFNVVMDVHLYDWQEPFTNENPEQHVQDAEVALTLTLMLLSTLHHTPYTIHPKP